MSHKYTLPFATLALVQNRGGGLYVGCNNFSSDYMIKHDSIVICRWGEEVKREASLNVRRRDAPDG